MHLKLLFLLFLGKVRTLRRFSLTYPLINFYAIVVMCVPFTYILNSTIIVSVVWNSVRSDSPSDAHISSCSIVLMSETIFLPEKLPLVFLLAEICWQLIGFCFGANIFLLPSFWGRFLWVWSPGGQRCSFSTSGASSGLSRFCWRLACSPVTPLVASLSSLAALKWSLFSVLAALQKRGNIEFILRFVEFFGSAAPCLLSLL